MVDTRTKTISLEVVDKLRDELRAMPVYVPTHVMTNVSRRMLARGVGSRMRAVAGMAAGAMTVAACQGSFVAFDGPHPVAVGASSPAESSPTPPPMPAPPASPALSASALPWVAGTWLGSGYTCPDGSAAPEEQIRIALDSQVAIATKVTGDNCVPAGAITWRGTPQGNSFPIQVQVGRPGSAKTFVSGQITRRGPDGFVLDGPGWLVTYRRAGSSGPSGP